MRAIALPLLFALLSACGSETTEPLIPASLTVIVEDPIIGIAGQFLGTHVVICDTEIIAIVNGDGYIDWQGAATVSNDPNVGVRSLEYTRAQLVERFGGVGRLNGGETRRLFWRTTGTDTHQHAARLYYTTDQGVDGYSDFNFRCIDPTP